MRKQNCLFTMVEMLVIIAVLVLLMSLLSTSYEKVGAEVHKLECANNLRSIALASSSYQNDTNGFVLGRRANYNRWFRSSGAFVSINYWRAYWGRYYSEYLGDQFEHYKNTFKCPEAQSVKYIGFEPFGQYATYGFNGVLFSSGGAFFENWNKAKSVNLQNPSQTAMIHDAYEPMMEGRGDTPNEEDLPTLGEIRRHNWAISTLWADGHHSFVEERWDRNWYRP